jgi:hypothetical protein
MSRPRLPARRLHGRAPPRASVRRREAQLRESRDPLLSAPLRYPQRKAQHRGVGVLAPVFRPCRRHAIRRCPRPRCCRRSSESLSSAHWLGLSRGPSQTSPRTSPEGRLLARAANPASAQRACSSVTPGSPLGPIGGSLATGWVGVSHERIAPMPSTTPLENVIGCHRILAAWLATTSFPVRSTLPPRRRLIARDRPHRA